MDSYLFNLINQFANRWPFLDTIGIFLATYLGYILILILTVFFFVDFRKYWKMIIGSLTAGFLARFSIVEIIRQIYPFNRPFVQGEINLLIQHSPSASFPSGHVSFFFAISFFMFFWIRKMINPPKYKKLILCFFFSFSFLIGIARVFSGVHWFSDILAGIIVGFFSGWLTKRLMSILNFN